MPPISYIIDKLLAILDDKQAPEFAETLITELEDYKLISNMSLCLQFLILQTSLFNHVQHFSYITDKLLAILDDKQAPEFAETLFTVRKDYKLISNMSLGLQFLIS